MTLLNKRIPTILGLLILVIGIGAGIYFVSKDVLFGPKLSPELAPKKVKITNVNHDQFTVSWITNQEAMGYVKHGKTPTLSTTIADDREQRSGTSISLKTHYVTVSGLQPNTKYYFKIGSGSEKNLYDNNGRPYEITTAPSLGASPPPQLANGNILTATGSPASGAIIYLTLSGATPLSALVANDGSWVVDLASALTTSLSSYVQLDPQTSPIDILAQGEDQISKALAVTANANPVPEITLGQTYDFRTETLASIQQADTSETTEPALPETTPQIPSQFPIEPLATPSGAASDSEVVLTNPSGEGETINSLRPEIIGTGPANKVLTITLNSPEEYTSTVVVNDQGTWSYTPPEDLEPGEHALTINYVDDEGEEQVITRNFIVAAAAEGLPSFTATPSASPSPEATSTPRISMPSTESGVPDSGTITPTLGISLLGFLLLGAGFVLKIISFKPSSTL